MNDVIQSDRDLAGDIWASYVAKVGEIMAEKAIREGAVDEGLPSVLANYRIAAEATLKAELAALQSKLRCIVSHATGGGCDGEGMTLNDISVRISQFRTRLWNDAKEPLIAERDAALARVAELEARLKHRHDNNKLFQALKDTTP